MSYDKERIAKIITDIEKYLKDLALLNPKELNDLKTYYASSMLLFAIANRIIDLGDAIVTGGEFGFPSKYREIFAILLKQGIIAKDMENKLSDLVYYRNLLSHEYTDVKPEDVKAFWKSIGIAKEFISKVKEFFDKKK